MTESLISYAHALQLTRESIAPLDSETVPLLQAVGRVTARELYALVDSPSVDVSLKDGYAIRAADIAPASSETPVHLRLIGSVAAGDRYRGEVIPGTALRILSGARIPSGADAVVSEEFASDDSFRVTVTNDAEPGRNILAQGSDVDTGQRLVPLGACLRPAQVGLLAAAGHSQVPVVRLPRVAILATGDEVVAPGRELHEGELYASNLVTLAAWCRFYGMATIVDVVRDDAETITMGLLKMAGRCDAIITSGGAWKGEHDLVVGVLDGLGWWQVYHRVRIGPGKAIGFGVWHKKPVFCLPGGPPSNQMAFLQLALPGLLKLAGQYQPALGEIMVRLTETVRGQKDWTQFLEGRFQKTDGEISFHPYKMASRLQAMGDAEGILAIQEGSETIEEGARTLAQVLPGVIL